MAQKIEKPIHFLHISKAGGTAVKNALQPYAEEYGILLHEHPTKLRDVPVGEKVFFFIRRPVERFVSGFMSRQRKGAPFYKAPWNDAETWVYENFKSANELAEAIGSADPKVRHSGELALNSILHMRRPISYWLESAEYVRERRDDILIIGQQERMDADFERLRKLLNLPETLTLPMDKRKSHRAPDDANRYLSPLAVANLLAWYGDDFRLYEECCALANAEI